MVKQYQVTRGINRLTSVMARLGVGRTQLMTTTGRKSGEARRVPVSPIVVDGVEYVVFPYGERGWVHNVRADPVVTLRHGSKQRQARLEEVGDGSGAPAMAAYHARESFARPLHGPARGSHPRRFRVQAGMFPVFKVTFDA